jgi:hypothetical protein
MKELILERQNIEMLRKGDIAILAAKDLKYNIFRI